MKAERPSSRGKRGTTYAGTGTWLHLAGASGGGEGVQTGEDQDIKLRNTNLDQIWKEIASHGACPFGLL